MGKLQVVYEPGHQRPYITYFRTGACAVDEASTDHSSFYDCLNFVLEQFNTRAPIGVIMQPVSLTIQGDLPKAERKVLEGIVEMYNDGAGVSMRLADPKGYRKIGEYHGHTESVHKLARMTSKQRTPKSGAAVASRAATSWISRAHSFVWFPVAPLTRPPCELLFSRLSTA